MSELRRVDPAAAMRRMLELEDQVGAACSGVSIVGAIAKMLSVELDEGFEGLLLYEQLRVASLVNDYYGPLAGGSTMALHEGVGFLQGVTFAVAELKHIEQQAKTIEALADAERENGQLRERVGELQKALRFYAQQGGKVARQALEGGG